MEIICIIVVLIILYYAIRCIYNKKSKATIFLFYRNGCGWCEKLKPEWKRFIEMHRKSTDIEIRAINSEENAEMADNYGVAGVPYIVRECNGVRTLYKGDRSAESLYKFSNER